MKFSLMPRMGIYYLYTKIRGYKTLQAFKFLDESQWWDSEKLREFQWEKLKRLLYYAKNNVPYYSTILKDININLLEPEEYSKVPLVTKEIMMQHTKQFISKIYNKKYLIPNSTSGSTGKNFRFYVDGLEPKRSGIRAAVALRGEKWVSGSIFSRKIQLWGVHSEKKTVLQRLSGIIFPTKFLSSFDLSPKNIKAYINEINHYKPDVIIAYASAIYVVAEYILENNLKVHSPRGIITSGETLFPFQRKIIEEAFEAQVFNRYGSREFGAIAHECEKHEGLHINMEHVYLEVINKNGEPAKPGELGEIVITDLDNYAMPFIRYRTGDLGVLSRKKCSCGRGLQLLERIEGRVFDLIVGTNGQVVTGTFWTIILREYINGVKQFQVIQESNDELVIRIVPSPEFNHEQEDRLTKIIKEKLGEDMKVTIERVDEIPALPSGKRRWVISNAKH